MRLSLRILLLAVTAAAACASCGRTVQRRVAVESVESVTRLGWSGAYAVLRVRNDMRREVSVESCRVSFVTAAGELARAELRGGAAVAPKSCPKVKLRFKITSANPSAMQALWRRFAAGDIGSVVLDIDAVVRIGGRQHKIYAAERSLSEILRNFGVAESEFATYFQ